MNLKTHTKRRLDFVDLKEIHPKIDLAASQLCFLSLCRVFLFGSPTDHAHSAWKKKNNFLFLPQSYFPPGSPLSCTNSLAYPVSRVRGPGFICRLYPLFHWVSSPCQLVSSSSLCLRSPWCSGYRCPCLTWRSGVGPGRAYFKHTSRIAWMRPRVSSHELGPSTPCILFVSPDDLPDPCPSFFQAFFALFPRSDHVPLLLQKSVGLHASRITSRPVSTTSLDLSKRFLVSCPTVFFHMRFTYWYSILALPRMQNWGQVAWVQGESLKCGEDCPTDWNTSRLLHLMWVF